MQLWHGSQLSWCVVLQHCDCVCLCVCVVCVRLILDAVFCLTPSFLTAALILACTLTFSFVPVIVFCFDALYPVMFRRIAKPR
jgi:hypothetical protein